MKKKLTVVFGVLVMAILLSACNENPKKNTNSDEGFVKLFNGENWDGWYLKIKKDDPELAKKVFDIDNGVVHVFKTFPDTFDLATGENSTHGLFYTEKTYSKYILRFEYKWGTKIGNNFDKWQYDAGCYYHVIDDKIWPTGIEYQIRYDHTTKLNHTADLIRPKGTAYEWYKNETNERYLYSKEGGVLDTLGGWMHLAAIPQKVNNLNEEWNECEVIVMGDAYAIHKLNGEVVNVAYNLSPDKGIIGLQGETAEIFYQNIEIKEFDKIPPIEEFLK